jgi:hypothetical protein
VAAAAGDAHDVTGVDGLADADVGLHELVAVAGDDAAGVVDVDVPAFSAPAWEPRRRPRFRRDAVPDVCAGRTLLSG